jgi:hypothetical protein
MKEDTHNNKSNGTLLDSLPKLNCFKVPDGYFTRLHQAVELRVQLDNVSFEEALSKLKKAQPYALPANYFDSLANKIEEKTKPVNFPTTEGFTVPQGYFETLYLKIVDRVAQENAPASVWWQNAGVVLRPALAFATVVTVALFVAWPYMNNKEGVVPVTASNQPAQNNTVTPNTNSNSTVVAPEVKTVAETVKNTTTKRVSGKNRVVKTKGDVGTEATALFDYTDDFYAEGLLSEAPEKVNDDDNSLVEIVSEENLDLADLMDGM